MGAVVEAGITVEEAREIAELHPDKRYELRYGQLVETTQPKYRHQSAISRLYSLLRSRLSENWTVHPECAYRGTPEHDARRADLGVISQDRHEEATLVDELFGAPDLVVEILSRSNRVGEMDDKEAFCLAHGCQSFWLVNPQRRTVKITDATGHVHWYHQGDSINLAPFSSESITVEEIFR